jgi:RHS repeat-associated protein
MSPADWMPKSDLIIPSFGDDEAQKSIQAPHVISSSEMERFRHKSMVFSELQPCSTPKKTGGVTVYGYRHYTPKTGQFLGRDPIEESGGMNLYVFVGNDGVNHNDYLGMINFGPWKFKKQIYLLAITLKLEFSLSASIDFDSSVNQSDCPDEWPRNIKFDSYLGRDDRDQHFGVDAWAGLVGDNFEVKAGYRLGFQWEGDTLWKQIWNIGTYQGARFDGESNFQKYITSDVIINGTNFKQCSCVKAKVDMNVKAEVQQHYTGSAVTVATLGLATYIAEVAVLLESIGIIGGVSAAAQ